MPYKAIFQIYSNYKFYEEDHYSDYEEYVIKFEHQPIVMGLP